MRDMIRLGQVETVRKRAAEATTALLGDTIALSDADWLMPTRLPGWTRAQVAQHLARSADAMRRLALTADPGHVRRLYASDQERQAELVVRPDPRGVDLQIDLDTSAGALDEAFSLVTDWLVPVQLPIGVMPLSAVVIARLHEVVAHHVDLRTNFTLDRVEPVVASWLLQWSSLWLGAKPHLPAVLVTSESGVVERIGTVFPERHVTGTDAALWGWLSGRTDGEGVEGADGLQWPPLG